MLSFLLTFIDDESDRQKLEAIYYKYSRLMKHIAFDILGNADAADDAVGDAFLKLIRYIDKLDDIESHKTKAFVVMTVKSVSVDIIRKRKESLIDDIDGVKDISYTDDIIEKISVLELKEKISELHATYRDILMLKVYYDFTDKQIASFYKITHSAARKRLERARTALLRSLEEQR